MKAWGSETRVLAPALTFPSEVTLENQVNVFGPQSPHLLKKKKKISESWFKSVPRTILTSNVCSFCCKQMWTLEDLLKGDF